MYSPQNLQMQRQIASRMGAPAANDQARDQLMQKQNPALFAMKQQQAALKAQMQARMRHAFDTLGSPQRIALQQQQGRDAVSSWNKQAEDNPYAAMRKSGDRRGQYYRDFANAKTMTRNILTPEMYNNPEYRDAGIRASPEENYLMPDDFDKYYQEGMFPGYSLATMRKFVW